MKETKMYLNYLNEVESAKMTIKLDFLNSGNPESKSKLISLASSLYSKDTRLNFISNNGRRPSEYTCRTYGKDKVFYTLVQFKQENLTEQILNELGSYDGEWSWRYFYAISLCEQDRELYIVSFSNACCPNWNNEYNVQKFKKLQDVDFPILKKNCTIYRMDGSLHAAINEELIENKITFNATENLVSMTIKDQHGNYCELEGKSIEDVFRNYADNFTGYRNYRRQMASEWEIVSDYARDLFVEWKKTAKGLKSDFDKFYGGGIVD